MSKTTSNDISSIESQEISDIVENLEHYQVPKEDVEKNRGSVQQVHKNLGKLRKIIVEKEDKETLLKRFKDFLYTFPGVSKKKIKELLKTISDFLDGIYPGFGSQLIYASIFLFIVSTFKHHFFRIREHMQRDFRDKGTPFEPMPEELKLFEKLINYVRAAGITSFVIHATLNWLLKGNPRFRDFLNLSLQAIWWIFNLDEEFLIKHIIRGMFNYSFSKPKVYILYIVLQKIYSDYLSPKAKQKAKNSDQNVSKKSTKLTSQSQQARNPNIRKRNKKAKKNTKIKYMNNNITITAPNTSNIKKTNKKAEKNIDTQKPKQNTKIKSMNNNIQNIIRNHKMKKVKLD